MGRRARALANSTLWHRSWAAAALPIATLAWVVAPWLADRLEGPASRVSPGFQRTRRGYFDRATFYWRRWVADDVGRERG
jgi:hypothetical protein